MWTTYQLRCTADIRDNYVRLPSGLADSMHVRYSSEVFCKPLRISSSLGHVSAVVGWCGGRSQSDDVEISPALGPALGLVGGTRVSVESLYDVRYIEKVNVRMDIELEELSEGEKNFLEENMLNQLCIVSNGKDYPIYLPRDRTVLAHVGFDQARFPLEYYYMKVDTELILSFKEPDKSHAPPEKPLALPTVEGRIAHDPGLHNSSLGLVLREANPKLENSFVELSYNRLANKVLSLDFDQFLKNAPHKKHMLQRLSSPTDSSLIFCVQSCIGCPTLTGAPKVLINTKTFSELHLCADTKVRIRAIPAPAEQPGNSKISAVIAPSPCSGSKQYQELVKRAVLAFVRSLELPTVLVHKSRHRIPWSVLDGDSGLSAEAAGLLQTISVQDHRLKLELMIPKDATGKIATTRRGRFVAVLRKEQIDSLEVTVLEKKKGATVHYSGCKEEPDTVKSCEMLMRTGTYKRLCEEVERDVAMSFENDLHDTGGILLCGDAADMVGKEVARRLAAGSEEIFAVRFDCLHLSLKGSLSNANMKGVREFISCKLTAAAQLHRRVLAIFDRLDALCPTVDSAGGNSGDSTVALKSGFYSTAIVELFDTFQGCRFIATSGSAASINSGLMRKGRFCGVRRLPALSAEDRGSIVRAISTRVSMTEKDTGEIAALTAKYEPEDFVQLLDLIQAGAGAGGSFVVSEVVKSLSGNKKKSVAGVKLYEGDISFKDIGGMKLQKQELEKVLAWPTRYPKLFAASPIKLHRGILLHGPTGCGKTMLGLASGREFGMNMITVNGAEVLNKYIGASEQNLRQVFEDARKASPCVIFFDEFDSLAPIRGSGSTGVTDRIVNQLLCYMDGFEDMRNVYVLAATSRPQAIDPAVLRPGRIDQMVECGLPGTEERQEIVRVAAGKLGEEVKWNVDFPDLAKKTEGLSGAELNGMVTDAYFSRAEGVKDGMITIEGKDFVIGKKKKGENGRKKGKVSPEQRVALM